MSFLSSTGSCKQLVCEYLNKFQLKKNQLSRPPKSLHSAFAERYYGIPSNIYGPAVNVSGQIVNSNVWNAICDLAYWFELFRVLEAV